MLLYIDVGKTGYCRGAILIFSRYFLKVQDLLGHIVEKSLVTSCASSMSQVMKLAWYFIFILKQGFLLLLFALFGCWCLSLLNFIPQIFSILCFRYSSHSGGTVRFAKGMF